MKKIDRYSMMIISQYCYSLFDLINIMCVCKKFVNLNQLFHYNPYDLSQNQLSFFDHLETFHFYNPPTSLIELKPGIAIVVHYEVTFFMKKTIENRYGRKITFKRVVLEEEERNELQIDNLNDIPKEVTILGYSCFALCELSDIVIPPNIHEIRENCFGGINCVSSLLIPSTVTYIDSFSFVATPLKSIILHDGLLLEMRAFEECPEIEIVRLTKGNEFHGYVDLNLKEILETNQIKAPNMYLDSNTFFALEFDTIIPNDFKFISDYCFSERLISQIVLSEGILSIGAKAFKGCIFLKNVSLPNSLTSIGNSCFSHCSTLNDITIPSQITTIPPNCFKECIGLSNIQFKGNVKEFGIGWNLNTKVKEIKEPTKKGDKSFKTNKNYLLQKYYCCHAD